MFRDTANSLNENTANTHCQYNRNRCNDHHRCIPWTSWLTD